MLCEITRTRPVLLHSIYLETAFVVEIYNLYLVHGRDAHNIVVMKVAGCSNVVAEKGPTTYVVQSFNLAI